MKKIIALCAFSALLLSGCGAPPVQPTTVPTTPAAGAGGSTAYSAADVAKHNSASDCWQIIRGQVYDVTSYVNQHPGGPAILKGCGQDATAMFDSIGKHAGTATQLLPQFLVGRLK